MRRELTSVLVANRGEIAVRIFRTAKRLGMRTIAVYSEADRDALFVSCANEAHLIGSAAASESYLRIDKIIDVAKAAQAACIHPGYGFLSERAEFAEACEEAGIVFVGPPASAIRSMGLKDAAKALATKAGVPVVPGYHGDEQDGIFLRGEAERIGYPVLIKAVAGGGGKGMRRVDRPGEFGESLDGARREAQNSFGNPRVLVEKYVLAPRHIEVQIFADSHGNAVSMFERDCSLQRRHQKVIEEAPAPGIPLDMRIAMGQAAVDAAKQVGYVGAGTVEFIADGSDGLRADRFYFMEMNTRLQVEHPVTEAITHLDLVELQLRVAQGEALPFQQKDLTIHGHAVEARLYAEDPVSGFLPSSGRLWGLALPEGEGIRVDTGVRQGDEVVSFYDPLIAKVIAHSETRDGALDLLSSALARTVVAGPKSNVAFLQALCDAEEFRRCSFDTGFIDRNLEQLTANSGEDHRAIRLGAKYLLERAVTKSRDRGKQPSAWARLDGFQLGNPRRQTFTVLAEGERTDVEITWPGPSFGIDAGAGTEAAVKKSVLVPAGDAVIVVIGGKQIEVAPFDPFDVDLGSADGGSIVRPPMHGQLVAVFVKPGDRVEKGQRLAIVEAMKMEHALVAPRDGDVIEVNADPGSQVTDGARLIVLAVVEK